MDQQFLDRMKIRLEEEKAKVEETIKNYTAREQPMDNPDEDDRAYDAAEDILEESIVDVHREILRKIDAALEKIAKGTYGKCEKCGTEIAAEDLEKEPWAEHCRICRRKRDDS